MATASLMPDWHVPRRVHIRREAGARSPRSTSPLKEVEELRQHLASPLAKAPFGIEPTALRSVSPAAAQGIASSASGRTRSPLKEVEDLKRHAMQSPMSPQQQTLGIAPSALRSISPHSRNTISYQSRHPGAIDVKASPLAAQGRSPLKEVEELRAMHNIRSPRPHEVLADSETTALTSSLVSRASAQVAAVSQRLGVAPESLRCFSPPREAAMSPRLGVGPENLRSLSPAREVAAVSHRLGVAPESLRSIAPPREAVMSPRLGVGPENLRSLSPPREGRRATADLGVSPRRRSPVREVEILKQHTLESPPGSGLRNLGGHPQVRTKVLPEVRTPSLHSPRTSGRLFKEDLGTQIAHEPNELQQRALYRGREWGSLESSWLARNCFGSWRSVTSSKAVKNSYLHHKEDQVVRAEQLMDISELKRLLAEKDDTIWRLEQQVTHQAAQLRTLQDRHVNLLGEMKESTARCNLERSRWADELQARLEEVEAVWQARMYELTALHEGRSSMAQQRLELLEGRAQEAERFLNDTKRSGGARMAAIFIAGDAKATTALAFNGWARCARASRLSQVHKHTTASSRIARHEEGLLAAVFRAWSDCWRHDSREQYWQFRMREQEERRQEAKRAAMAKAVLAMSSGLARETLGALIAAWADLVRSAKLDRERSQWEQQLLGTHQQHMEETRELQYRLAAMEQERQLLHQQWEERLLDAERQHKEAILHKAQESAYALMAGVSRGRLAAIFSGWATQCRSEAANRMRERMESEWAGRMQELEARHTEAVRQIAGKALSALLGSTDRGIVMNAFAGWHNYAKKRAQGLATGGIAEASQEQRLLCHRIMGAWRLQSVRLHMRSKDRQRRRAHAELDLMQRPLQEKRMVCGLVVAAWRGNARACRARRTIDELAREVATLRLDLEFSQVLGKSAAVRALTAQDTLLAQVAMSAWRQWLDDIGHHRVAQRRMDRLQGASLDLKRRAAEKLLWGPTATLRLVLTAWTQVCVDAAHSRRITDLESIHAHRLNRLANTTLDLKRRAAEKFVWGPDSLRRMVFAGWKDWLVRSGHHRVAREGRVETSDRARQELLQWAAFSRWRGVVTGSQHRLEVERLRVEAEAGGPKAVPGRIVAVVASIVEQRDSVLAWEAFTRWCYAIKMQPTKKKLIPVPVESLGYGSRPAPGMATAVFTQASPLQAPAPRIVSCRTSYAYGWPYTHVASLQRDQMLRLQRSHLEAWRTTVTQIRQPYQAQVPRTFLGHSSAPSPQRAIGACPVASSPYPRTYVREPVVTRSLEQVSGGVGATAGTVRGLGAPSPTSEGGSVATAQVRLPTPRAASMAFNNTATDVDIDRSVETLPPFSDNATEAPSPRTAAASVARWASSTSPLALEGPPARIELADASPGNAEHAAAARRRRLFESAALM